MSARIATPAPPVRTASMAPIATHESAPTASLTARLVAHVARRELLDHLRSARFLALCALALLLLPLGAHLGARSWEQRRAFAEWLVERQRERARLADASADPDDGAPWGWHGGEPPPDPALRLVREAEPLSALVAGNDVAAPAWWQPSSEGLVAGAPAPGGDGAAGALESLDTAFVVQVVLGLLALLLTFDAVAGEQETGVLRVVLAHPVPRLALVLGKFAGALATLALPLVAGTLGALLVMQGHSLPLGAVEWGRAGLVAVAALLYVATMLGAGLAVSALATRGKTALVVLLLAWTFLVLVLPRAAGVVAGAVRPVLPDEVHRRARADAIAALESERGRLLAAAWRAASGSDSLPRDGALDPGDRRRYVDRWLPLEAELFRRKRAALRDLEAARQRAEGARAALERTLSLLSPAGAFAESAAELAGTGAAARDARLRQVAARQESLERDVFDHVYGLEVVEPRTGLHVRWAPSRDDPARPPAYATLGEARLASPTATRAIAAAAPSLVILAGMASLALLAAAVAFDRYEVR